MKTIRLIIAGLVMTMGFSSCSSLFYDAKVDVLNSIQKGMSRQEVTKILGTPEYRRFDRDIEEWEYSRVLSGKSNISRTQIVVTFEGGRVVAMDSFSGEPRTLPVVPSEHNTILSKKRDSIPIYWVRVLSFLSTVTA